MERSVLMRIAPSLVKPQKFLLPTGWKSGSGRIMMAAGLAVNALITVGRNRSLAPTHRIGAGQIISRDEVGRLVPDLKLGDVSGGAVWYDGMMVDSERLCLAFVMSARDHGAVVRNYTGVEKLLGSDGTVEGLLTRDTITGKEAEIRARVVVSCQGPWAQTDSEPLFGKPECAGVLKAVNLILPNTGIHCGVGFPARGQSGRPNGERLFFAVPWHGLTLVGTWYFESLEHSDELSISEHELELMLNELNSGFDRWCFEPADILAAHIGQQPIGNGDPTRKTPISKPLIKEASHFGGLSRSWIVQGEKWTTVRQTAQKALDVISMSERMGASKSVSASLPLNTGAEVDDGVAAIDSGIRNSADAITDGQKEQLLYSLRHEMVRTLPDLVMRRTNIGAGRRPDSRFLHEIAALAAVELGWSAEEKILNIDAVNGHRMYSRT